MSISAVYFPIQPTMLASRLTKLRIISWHYTWLIFQLHWLSKGNFWLLFKSTSKQRKNIHSSLQGFKLKQTSLPRPFSEEIGSNYRRHNHSCHAPSYLLPYGQKAAGRTDTFHPLSLLASLLFCPQRWNMQCITGQLYSVFQKSSMLPRAKYICCYNGT